MHRVFASSNLWDDLVHGMLSWGFLQFVVAFLSAFGFVLTSAVILVLAERKILAWMQDRQGPLHTGPGGSLQSVADVGKLLLKEIITPRESDKEQMDVCLFLLFRKPLTTSEESERIPL